MSKPGEHKTVQPRILAYAQEIGWSFVSREEAEQRRASSPKGYAGTGGTPSTTEDIRKLSLFFDDLLDAKVRTFNPRYTDAEGAPRTRELFRHLHTDIYGNRDFVNHLRNRGKFFDHEESHERDLILIDSRHVPSIFATEKGFCRESGKLPTKKKVFVSHNVFLRLIVVSCRS